MKKNDFRAKFRIKLFFFSLLTVLAACVLYYSNWTVEELVAREKNNLKLFADVYQHIGAESAESTVFIFDKVIPTISYPLVMTLDDDEPIYPYQTYTRNLSIDTSQDIAVQKEYVQELVCKMDKSNPPINIQVVAEGDTMNMRIHYSNSALVDKLRIFPLLELGLGIVVILLGYMLWTGIKKSEESRVWVGMAKETAHQLGTPLSSLMAWIEILKYGKDDPQLVESTCTDMLSDVTRLNTIATRFSKIGSTPDLTEGDISSALNEICEYFDKRLPVLGKRIEIIKNIQDNIVCRFNSELFAWVIENLLKNAAEAIEEKDGMIYVTLLKSKDDGNIHILITDNGKGMTKKQKKEVFLPGYSTKKRGWGLGLSLSKRIICEYHRGRIFVKESAPGKGTTFFIELSGSN